MANGILLPVIDFTGFAEDEFNDWYDLEHIPERRRVPGFLVCERSIGAHSPKISVATYELDDVDVLKIPAYHAIGNHALGGDNLSVWSKRVTGRVKMLMRFEGEQILPGGGIASKDAPALLLNAMSVAPEHEHEFDDSCQHRAHSSARRGPRNLVRASLPRHRHCRAALPRALFPCLGRST